MNDAQVQTENEIRAALKISNYLSLDEALTQLDSMLVKINDIDNDPLVLQVHYQNLYVLAQRKYPIDKLEKAVQIVLSLSEELKNHKTYALALTIQAAFYQNNQFVEKEISAYKRAIQYAKKHQLKGVLAGNLSNLGNRYVSLGLFDKALVYFQEAVKVDDSLLFLKNLANTYVKMGNVDEAERLIATNIKTKTSLYNSNLLAVIYTKQGKFKKAQQVLKETRKNLMPLSMIKSAYLNITEGELLYATKEYADAVEVLKKGLASNTYLSPQGRLDILLLLGKSHFNLKEYQLASIHYAKWAALSEETHKKHSKQAITVLLAEFEFEREVAKKEQAKKELQVANDELLAQKKVKYLNIIITILSLSMALVIGFFYYNLQKKSAKLINIANTDELTKIKNRRSLINALDNRIENFDDGTYLSVAMLDIDHFKRINDNYGHDIGDKVLIEFTSFVSSFLRQTDIFGRFGGEEFLIIFQETNAEQAKIILERLIIELSNFKFTDVGSVTFSAGISQYHNQDMKNLLIEADEKLYKAKNDGRNQVV